jgi:hypothetical protein
MIISYNFELKSIKPCHPPVAVAHGQPFAHRATQPEPPRRPFAPGQGYPHGRMQSAVPITSTTATMKATPRPGFPLPGAASLAPPAPSRNISDSDARPPAPGPPPRRDDDKDDDPHPRLPALDQTTTSTAWCSIYRARASEPPAAR